jgi:hypothetical protein
VANPRRVVRRNCSASADAGILLSLQGFSCFISCFDILSLTTAEPEKIAIFVKIATSKISDKKRDNPADAPEFSILEMLADVYIASRREIQGRFEDFHEENLIQRALYERVFPNRWTFDRRQNNVCMKQQLI